MRRSLSLSLSLSLVSVHHGGESDTEVTYLRPQGVRAKVLQL